MCTRTLGDLGARVIKVENPAGGDFARRYDDVVGGLAAHFVWAVLAELGYAPGEIAALRTRGAVR